MKRRLTALALGAIMVSGAAQAADLPYHKAPPPAPYIAPAPVANWTGLYGGLNIGGGWFDRAGSNGFVAGGGQLGYNYQLSPLFVIGLETDFQGASGRLDWFGTVRGRVGITPFSPNLLLYGTGGFAYGEVAFPGVPGNVTNTRTGWTAGGGVEWMFAPNWSVKAEYLRVDISGNGVGFLRRTQANIGRVGLNYHFNWGVPAPVYAKF